MIPLVPLPGLFIPSSVAFPERSYYHRKGFNSVPAKEALIMIFHETKIKGIKKQFDELEKIMKGLGLVRWSWDYGKAIYDYKYTHEGVDYYLRFGGKVVNDKRLESPKAVLEMGDPVFARHFFPHGLDENAEVPEALIEEVNRKIAEVEKALN
jgi:YugN-like family